MQYIEKNAEEREIKDIKEIREIDSAKSIYDLCEASKSKIIKLNKKISKHLLTMIGVFVILK